MKSARRMSTFIIADPDRKISCICGQTAAARQHCKQTRAGMQTVSSEVARAQVQQRRAVSNAMAGCCIRWTRLRL